MSFQDQIDALDRADERPDHKKLALAGAALIAIIGALVIFFGYSGAVDASSVNVVEAQESSSAQEEGDDPSQQEVPKLCVYVTGHVVSPGVVYLDEGSRVADAIDACGGMLPDAAAASLNLARPIADGEQISVQSEEEVASSAVPPTGADASAASTTASSGGLVNINTADVSQFTTLSGIGESKAKKIVEYREKNGPFKSIDDLTNVSGIGEKTVESIRDGICL